MPRIELIEVPLYQPEDYYHWSVDNIPLKNLIRRQELINLALDDVIEQLRDAVGTQGTVANRLNQSINADGSLKTAAIDEALHDISEHADSETHVRMTRDEADKLALLADEATNVRLEVEDEEDEFVEFDAGLVKLQRSATVYFDVTAPNIVKAHTVFPLSAAHQHIYNATPVAASDTEDFINYKVNSTATPYVEDSLRVTVNGLRIYPGIDAATYVPGSLVDDAWTSLYFTPDHTTGTFALSQAISDDDVIRIDYDLLLS